MKHTKPEAKLRELIREKRLLADEFLAGAGYSKREIAAYHKTMAPFGTVPNPERPRDRRTGPTGGWEAWCAVHILAACRDLEAALSERALDRVAMSAHQLGAWSHRAFFKQFQAQFSKRGALTKASGRRDRWAAIVEEATDIEANLAQRREFKKGVPKKSVFLELIGPDPKNPKYGFSYPTFARHFEGLGS